MRSSRLLGVLALAVGVAAGCVITEQAMPRCEPGQRLGLIAQSVPEAAYLPCIEDLPPGWELEAFEVRDGRTRFTLRSDRAREPVEVELAPDCEVTAATPVVPRAEGVRTLLQVSTIGPSFAGSLLDVFPGGCITYRFDFDRGPHITLIDELQQAVGLYPRRDLRLELRDRLGVELD